MYLWSGWESQAAEERKREVIFLAGPRGENAGEDDFPAGCRLLAVLLNEQVPGIRARVLSRWPGDPGNTLRNTSAVVLYLPGGGSHPLHRHLDEMEALRKRGVGLVCLHESLEVQRGKPGSSLLEWVGGFYESHWSVGPLWTARFERVPEHAITRGVRPFRIRDQWLYHMRFREGLKGVTPILSALPPDSTRSHGDGRRQRRSGSAQHLAWARERPGGGRGFGFTGGHFHRNWAQQDFRKLILNAIVWAAGMEVPPAGVPPGKVE
jgi:hypothetical protein